MNALASAIVCLALCQAQDGPKMVLADRRLLPGSTVIVTGSDFAAGSRIRLALAGMRDTIAVGLASVATDGGFIDSLRVSRTLAPGAYRLIARAGDIEVAALDVAILAAPARGSRAERATPTDRTGHAVDSMPGRGPATVMPSDEWPEWHAALNDLPAALLLFAVAFEWLGVLAGRPSLRSAAFWTLVTGTAGTVIAVIAGLMAERVVAHDDLAHAAMERHKLLGLITLGVFVGLTAWRVMRRDAGRRSEQLAWCAGGTIGVVLLIVTSNRGGNLMFNHALGVPSSTLRAVLERRGDWPLEHSDSATADSTGPAAGARPHRDPPGAAPHRHD